MKAKTRLLWMKLHAYLACFFLPITLVYIVTGTLYMFDIKGDVNKEYEYSVTLTDGWPETEALALPLVNRFLLDKSHKALPGDYYFENGNHDWYGFRQEVILIKPDAGDTAKLVVKEHDLLLQLLIVHKGFAGQFFKWFSVLFAASLSFSIISGVVITLQLPQLKTPALYSILAGGLMLIVGFFV
ncbi:MULTISPECIES: hypothetical protein [Shewanella]|uniref:Uncharacterized protein n=1 Tax=Shewanella fidelis TaxID=173509 RepID=A0AAW8NK06_9GAMM|nr:MULTISPECIES: hypothetical protein [Shewanella]MDR8522710.1 hypothetical protein [Shewanella fidelis]MDW4812325.1 hypothetical protein [Shewanella fidelis]MDW4816010.1 hypothetical protein [Shewanella fidelis]MDW4820566.1 hypothetical protein [Shewanella fidelis]MDW4824789.1 hypothetical protein [Shewanella fidelis]